MANPRAKSFLDMLALTTANQHPKNPFPVQMMLAIFWEESLFVNKSQTGGGPAIGFGQVERPQLFNVSSNNSLAVEGGYDVPGVTTDTPAVDDATAVKISTSLLVHYFIHKTNKGPNKKQFALEAYAGVGAAAGTPKTAADRLVIIERWKTCALQLEMVPLRNGQIQISSFTFIGDLEDALIGALQKAKFFRPNDPDRQGAGSEMTVRQRLFPPLWHLPQLAPLVPQFMASPVSIGVGAAGLMVKILQELLNTQDVPDFILTPDGQFGPQTLSGVKAFQQSRKLVADGIVGPKTKRALATT
jgi:hypothetical protein